MNTQLEAPPVAPANPPSNQPAPHVADPDMRQMLDTFKIVPPANDEFTPSGSPAGSPPPVAPVAPAPGAPPAGQPPKARSKGERIHEEYVVPAVTPLQARIQELEAQHARTAGELELARQKLTEVEPAAKRLTELEPLASRANELETRLKSYDETLINAFAPPYDPRRDPEVSKVEKDVIGNESRLLASLVNVNDFEDGETATDGEKLRAKLQDWIVWGVKQNGDDFSAIKTAKMELRKAGFRDVDKVYDVIQNITEGRSKLGSVIESRRENAHGTMVDQWKQSRSLFDPVRNLFTVAPETIQAKITKGERLDDNELVLNLASQVFTPEEMKAFQADLDGAVRTAEETFAGPPPMSREELMQDDQKRLQLVTRQNQLRQALPGLIFRGAATVPLMSLVRSLSVKLAASEKRASELSEVDGIGRHTGSPTITPGTDGKFSVDGAMSKLDATLAGLNKAPTGQ